MSLEDAKRPFLHAIRQIGRLVFHETRRVSPLHKDVDFSRWRAVGCADLPLKEFLYIIDLALRG